MRADSCILRALVGVAAVLAVAGLAGCGSARPDPAVIRVGDVPVTRRAVEHWTSIITRGALVENLTGSTQPTAREEALALLIGSAWLEDEAARDGLRPSRGEVARLLDGQRSLSQGTGGFATTLSETGETLADVEAEARAKWAAGALKRRLTEAVNRYARARVTDRLITGFYRSHAVRYHRPERRYYDLYEQIPKKSEALALARRLRRGESINGRPNKEKPFRPRNFRHLPRRATTFRAVFSAKRTNVVHGPLPLQGAWCLFILRRIVPARLQPLAEVRGSIERQLLAYFERRERARLIAAYRRRWLAQTDCASGYVIQKCRQFKGAGVPEPDPFASSQGL
jgi:hypothetical protein